MQHFHICRVSPQLRHGDTCQIWTWDSIGNQWFDNGEKSGNLRAWRTPGSLDSWHAVQTTFRNTFFDGSFLNFDWNFHSKVSNSWWASISSEKGGGGGPSRQQTIIGTNECLYYWRIYELINKPHITAKQPLLFSLSRLWWPAQNQHFCVINVLVNVGTLMLFAYILRQWYRLCNHSSHLRWRWNSVLVWVFDIFSYI